MIQACTCPTRRCNGRGGQLRWPLSPLNALCVGQTETDVERQEFVAAQTRRPRGSGTHRGVPELALDGVLARPSERIHRTTAVARLLRPRSIRRTGALLPRVGGGKSGLACARVRASRRGRNEQHDRLRVGYPAEHLERRNRHAAPVLHAERSELLSCRDQMNRPRRPRPDDCDEAVQQAVAADAALELRSSGPQLNAYSLDGRN